MKRVVLIIAIVFGLAIAGLAIFLLTFDADRYRPLVVSQLQSALGKPVTLSRISLGWRNGLVVQLDGFAIREDAIHPEPMIQAETVSALVRLWPLLKKDVQVASIVVMRPQIHIGRDAQGKTNLMGLAALGAPAAASGQQATIGDTPVSLNIRSLQIRGGSLHVTDAMVSPPTDVRVTSIDATVSDISPGKPMTLDVRGAFDAETQNIQVHGMFLPPSPPVAGAIEALRFSMERVSVERLAPPAGQGQPQLHGRLTVELEGRVPSLEPQQMISMAAGQGRLQLDQPRVANLNVLRVVFEKLSMIPGVVERLHTRLPPSYQEKLTATDTVFSPIALSMRLEQGMLRCDEVRLSTDTFQLVGNGVIGLDRSVMVQGMLTIDPELSSAIVSSVNELRGLTNREGAIELPVTVQGRAPDIAVLPDVRYIASRILATKATDVIHDLLNPPQEAPVSPTAEPTQPADLLGQFLQRALQKNLPDQPASQ